MLMLSPCAMAQEIPIADVEALYSALDNPAYDGATLVLAPTPTTCRPWIRTTMCVRKADDSNFGAT